MYEFSKIKPKLSGSETVKLPTSVPFAFIYAVVISFATSIKK